jgi:excisionase family DNA binding protein
MGYPRAKPKPEFCTTQAVATRLGLARGTVMRLIKQHDLEAIRVQVSKTHQWRVKVASVDAYIKRAAGWS